ncbi:MAG: YggS family pyridoxal phosphate-dependent enzyme [Flavobacterium sp. BFFFF2]|nr:MAG: YggS family pyridoxal phosphate-dependent enzyme [Flavobacterium sp. BFFFF2]
MSQIAQQIAQITTELLPNVTLVAVSKTQPLAALESAYQAGQRHFGENKVQEMTAKWEQLPKDIHWHMIGHLQRNKVKYMAPYVALVHGVDSLALLAEIDRQAQKCGRIIPCLLQVFIAQEETKFGFDQVELIAVLTSELATQFPNIRIKGLMGMASNTDDQAQIRKEFAGLKQLFDHFAHMNPTAFDMTILSMGMSGDFHIAMEEGSTLIRVGSRIFGGR